MGPVDQSCWATLYKMAMFTLMSITFFNKGILKEGNYDKAAFSQMVNGVVPSGFDLSTALLLIFGT